MPGRRFTKEEKLKIAKEALEAGNASLVGRRYQIHGTVVARWAKTLQQQGDSGFREARSNGRPKPDAELRGLTSENQWLKRILAEKDLEIAILKDALKKTLYVKGTVKTLYVRQPWHV